MMELYAIRRDGFDYQDLNFRVTDLFDFFPADIDESEVIYFSLKNTALSQYWKLRKTGWSKIEGRKNLIPDVTKWINSTLLLSPRAYRYLKDLMLPFGEFLPVQIEDEKDPYYIFNCLRVAEVDESKSNADEGKMVFLEESIGDKLFFKTPYQACKDIYCTGRVKEQIESLGFKGIIFDEQLFSKY